MNEIVENRASVGMPQYGQLNADFNAALSVVDDIVFKNYISNISSMDIIPIEEVFSADELKTNISDNIRMLKIGEMVYEKDENAIYKFASVFNTVASTGSSVFVVIQSDGKRASFYMGIRSQSESNSATTAFTALKNSIQGQFPGIKIEAAYNSEINQILSDITDTSKGNSKCVSCVTGIAANKSQNTAENNNFVQGLEKFVMSMQGEKYTAVILANSKTQAQITQLRTQYEDIYTQLSAFANSQVSYNVNYSTNYTSNTSSSVSHGKTFSENFSESTSHSETSSVSTSHTTGSNYSETQKSKLGKLMAGVGSISAAATVVGTVLAPFTAVASMTVSAGVAAVSGACRTETTGESEADTETHSDSTTEGNTHTEGKAYGTSDSTTETIGSSTGNSQGTSQNLQLNVTNKRIDDILKRIDVQIQRIDEFESSGLWECAAYFISDGGDKTYVSKIAASSYKALIKGEQSGIETSSISTWNGDKALDVLKYVVNFSHPYFSFNKGNTYLPVTSTSFVSGDELAIHMGLPRKSVCGLPVIEHASFGKEVVSINTPSVSNLEIGYINNMGKVFEGEDEYKNITVGLDVNSLAMHTFITGSTGSGKSNTIYLLLNKLRHRNVRFMVIEPTKGEYKNVFGNKADVTVLGTNPAYSQLLKINPFSFPADIHVLEHIDRLVEIFNVCWPMYAAMPAVLKNAIEKSYEDCGWNLTMSSNDYGEGLYPQFADIEVNIKRIIDGSEFDAENKGAYKGALVTRVHSLTNGINGLIFTDDEIPSEKLFDENVIVDLSRVGSSETKSLIMGMLVLKLQEYRMTKSEMNSPLKHITVLEEAHNLLKRTSTEQNSETANLLGKSVEMLSNAIAEMRTYGEGFIIADQSPCLLDMAAIRNTNTKIILRLPDISDRELVGKAANLNEAQITELAKLPCGAAAVYQNEWMQPVLCKVHKYDVSDKKYVYEPDRIDTIQNPSRIMLLHIAEMISSATALNDTQITENIIPELNRLHIRASVIVEVVRYLKNPSSQPRMTRLAPIMSAFFPTVRKEMVEAYKESSEPSEWTRRVENSLMSNVENGCLSDRTRHDIIQAIITDYVYNELGKAAELEWWSTNGILR